QIDPEKIGIIGSSAGGHLALLSATRPAPEIERPNAAIGLGAQTDFTAPHIQNAVEGPRHELYGPFLGGSFREAYHNYRDASPLHHLSHDDPPVGIISGELDQPSTRASRFRHEAMRLGIPTDLEVIANAPHALLRNAAFRKEAVATAREFFEKAFEEPAPVVESLSDSAPDFPKLQPWTRLGGGYSGCEGAQWLPGPENSGPILIYAAHHDGLFFRWSAELGLRLWIDETPETSTLRPTAGGSLIGVDQSTRLLRRFSNVGVPGEVLVEQFEEKRLNRPNDLRIHPTTKRIWFTDPNFLFRQRPLETQELPGQYVFCYSPSPNGGTLAAPIRDLDLPNGIAISRDGKALFVGDSKRRQVFRFQFTGPSSVAKREIFANFEEPIDGLAFSPQGHLWVAAGNGFSLLNENGEAIYRMTLNEKATSAAFFVEDQITHIAVTTREAAYVSRYSSQ
ncbi:MAG: SMP-30/gluconolactonase/LRE family protein, partial [Verrucomicrobiota bacterium]